MAMATPRLVLANKINVSDSYDELVSYGGNQSSLYQINADGSEGSFQNSVQFTNITAPNVDNCLIGRSWRILYNVNIEYDRTDPNCPKFPGVVVNADGTHSLGVSNQNVDTTTRPYPLNSVADTIQLTLNSSQLNYQSRICNDVIQRFIKKEIHEYKTIECPTQPDNNWILTSDNLVSTAALPVGAYANWAAVVAAGPITVNVGGTNVIYTPGGGAPPAVGTALLLSSPPGTSALAYVSTLWVAAGIANIGTIRLMTNNTKAQSNQPLSRYENSCGGYTRASFLPVNVVNGALPATNTIVTFQIVEAVFCSPLSLLENEAGLARVNTASLLYTYSRLQQDFLVSSNPNMVVDNITIANPRLLLNYTTVSPSIVKIPMSVTYPYEQVVPYSKVLSGPINMPTTQSYTFNTDTIRLSNTPHRIYLAVRRQITQRNSSQSSTFYGLGQPNNVFAGLNINFGNRTGLLASASNQDLYRMASQCGYNGSFVEWSRSGIYAFDPVKHFGIDPETENLPLESGFVNLQITGYYNANGVIASGATDTSTPEYVLIVVYAGAVNVSVDTVMQSLNLLTEGEMNAVLKKSPVDGTMVSSEQIQPTIYGSGLFSSGKALLGKLASSEQAKSLAKAGLNYLANKLN